MFNPAFKNTILKALAPTSSERLHLTPLPFELRHEIEFPGNPIANLFFLERGMASMTTSFSDGSEVETGMFGYESVIGVSALMGTKRSLNRIYTQIPGNGYSCTVEHARAEFERGGTFQKLCLAYVQAQLVQTIQSVGCNRVHRVEQRLARYLLLCADRAHANSFVMPHEFLADMLGVSRPTITVTAGILKDERLIEYSRGSIHILNLPGLEKRACECYAVIRDYLHDYAEFDTGTSSDRPDPRPVIRNS
jgi:CRP-like cAMP-binding protein